MDLAVKVNPGGVNTAHTDLSAFRARGGKLLVYHGRSDEAVTSTTSRNFFQSVQATLDLTLEQTHDFYRVFYIPGMHHCKTGPGAWNIGQVGVGRIDPKMADPRHNALLALVEWTEKGTPPVELVGSKYKHDNISEALLSQRGKSESWQAVDKIIRAIAKKLGRVSSEYLVQGLVDTSWFC